MDFPLNLWYNCQEYKIEYVYEKVYIFVDIHLLITWCLLPILVCIGYSKITPIA